MRFELVPALALASALLACGSPELVEADACTNQAVGDETGAGSLRATLMVPEQYFSGVETRNGGISIELSDCDFPLNAFLSDETAAYIIDAAPDDTLTDAVHGYRFVDADLSIWKFTDGSGEPRFFVTRVHQMMPVRRPRTALEAQRLEMPQNGS